eukprot:1159338-Pelagomonas_calceolata.AAC.19
MLGAVECPIKSTTWHGRKCHVEQVAARAVLGMSGSAMGAGSIKSSTWNGRKCHLEQAASRALLGMVGSAMGAGSIKSTTWHGRKCHEEQAASSCTPREHAGALISVKGTIKTT